MNLDMLIYKLKGLTQAPAIYMQKRCPIDIPF